MTGKHFIGAPAHLRREQQICDSIQADFRAENKAVDRPAAQGFNVPLDIAAVPTANELDLLLAEGLEYARRMLEAMGDELSADMAVVMRHGVALQSIDIVGQILGHIATVTRSVAPELAVERIGMCELKARLSRRNAG